MYATKLIRIIVLLTIIINLNCASTGLIGNRHAKEYYEIPKLLPENAFIPNSTFIVYSDNQACWRIKEKFLNKSNWTNWRMLLFPFYELYLLGNGFVGTVNWLRHNPDYGATERIMVRDAVYDAAREADAAFILNAGDIAANDGRRPTHWEIFLKENKIDHPLVTEFPYLPVLGNHEHANDNLYGRPNYDAIFDFPGFYTQEFDDAIIIITDSNMILDQYRDIDDTAQDSLFEHWFVSKQESGEPAWLEHQLAKSHKRFKIVIMHHPPISIAKHHDDWYNASYGNDLLEKRRRLLKLFDKYNVQLVFSGHDHTYQHNVLNTDDNRQIHFLVGGGGGGSLRNPVDPGTLARYHQNFNDEGLDVNSLNIKKMYHYFLVQVKQDELNVKVIEVNKDLEYHRLQIEEIIIY
jgi:hypothetical protein